MPEVKPGENKDVAQKMYEVSRQYVNRMTAILKFDRSKALFELKEGMVFALETYCPASDGVSAARIEEEVVVTATGCKVITRFPAKELFIANEY